MREIDLQTAVDEIATSTLRKQGQFPFFLIVGSGISHPQIPLAPGIEELCRKRLADDGRDLARLALDGKSALDRYAALFEAAYTQPEDRQEFLHDLIHRAPISAANFRLAHLLGECQLTNLVFTPNFDEMLTRACRLLGYDVVACDHPKTTGRILPSAVLPQIVHVHGTHWFYDCCNLKDEIEAQAQNDRLDGLSMGQLLDRVLADRSPIVVGYSGWEGDVMMAALKRRLGGSRLPRHLYWFCFKRSDADNLPSWLKDHASVRLVLPPPLQKFEGKRRGSEVQFTGELSSISRERLAGEESEKEPSLPAREVFEAFIRRLDLKAPRLTAEPLEFFAEHLAKNLSADEEDEAQDFFLIRQALGRVQEGSRLERESRRGSAAKNLADELLERVSDSLRRSDYSGALEAAREVDLGTLTPDQRASFDDALEKVYLGTSEPEDEVAACEIRLHLAEVSRDAESGNSSDWISREAKASQHLASALFNKGVALRHAGCPDEAVAAYEEVERRFGDNSEPVLRELVAKALVNKGVALGQAGRTDEELAAYEEVERRFADAPEPALGEPLAKALVNKGVALGQAGRTDEELAAYEEVERRFADAPESALREPLAEALANKGLVLGEAGRPDEAVAAYEEVERRFADAPEPALRALLAEAKYNLASVLLTQSRLQEALVAARRAVVLGSEHYNLACALARLGELDEAFSELEYCLTKGEISREDVLQDSDWEQLLDHPRFQELTKESAE